MKNQFKIHWVATFLLLMTLHSYAQIGVCFQNCENTYNDEMNTAFDVYLSCIASPPSPGGVGVCLDNWYQAQQQAYFNREYCRLNCQGGGTPSNPNNVSIISSDLVKINQVNTSSGLVEIKMFSEESNYQQVSLNTTIPIPAAPLGQWEFAFGIENIRNQRPDLFCIKKTGTSSGMMEIHILSGQSNYQSFLTQRATTLPVSTNDWEFIVGAPNTNLDPTMFNYPNPPFQIGGRVFAIQKNGTSSGNTEVSILEYGNNFNYQVQSKTVLPLIQTSKNWRFSTGDWNQDGTADLMAINTKTSSGNIEITIFDGANYFAIMFQSTVPFALNRDWDFFAAQYYGLGDEEPEFFGIDKLGSNNSILVNINNTTFAGYPYATWQNLSIPAASDTTSRFVPSPSYDCTTCPD